MRVYNDWMIDFCSVAPDRFWGLAMISLWNVDHAVQELERCKKAGLRGGSIWIAPPEDLQYSSERYEPFWAAAQDLRMPLSLHTATRRVGLNSGAAKRTIHDASRRATKAFLPALSLSDIIFSGVCERYPRLQLAIVEFELSWASYLLSTMDYTYRERHEEAAHRFKDELVPSDFFHRQVFLSFQEDAVGIRLRDVIGTRNIMWGSDYPHSESTFPRSLEILDRILLGVPDEDRARIVGANAAELYGFDLARLTRATATGRRD
jgi:predicted TIM-barrel fold metal-dependent hydrolase